MNDMTNLEKAKHALGGKKIDLESIVNERVGVIVETVVNMGGKDVITSTGIQYWSVRDVNKGESNAPYKNTKFRLLTTLEEYNNNIQTQ